MLTGDEKVERRVEISGVRSFFLLFFVFFLFFFVFKCSMDFASLVVSPKIQFLLV